MQQLNKTQARTYYNKGKNVYLLPNRVRLTNTIVMPVKINIMELNNDFDNVIVQFENSSCNERVGNLASYYID